jgi:hypothetical protein
MTYLVNLDVDNYGYLTGSDEYVSALDVATHNWLEPYPQIDHELRFGWVPGEGNVKPDAYRHNLLRDFACSARALKVLNELASGDLRLIASGRLGDDALSVIQAVSVLDVVESDKSLYGNNSWGGMEFPHIPEAADKLITRRIFRVPDVGMSLSVFVGDEVRQTLIDQGIQGFLFIEARVEQE